MKTKTINLYQFNELSEQAKQNAIEKLLDVNVDYEWFEFIFEDVKEVGKILGIEIDKIYFTGFYSQGDGACFEGSYSYSKNCINEIKNFAPQDEKLHSIAKDLKAIQSKHFYKLTANVKQSGRYMHENCTEIDVFKDGEYLYSDSELTAESELKDALKDFMRWIYRHLETAHDSLTSEESIKETIEANEYDFDINGNLI